MVGKKKGKTFLFPITIAPERLKNALKQKAKPQLMPAISFCAILSSHRQAVNLQRVDIPAQLNVSAGYA